MWTFAGRTSQAWAVVCAKSLTGTCWACYKAAVGWARSQVFGDEGGAELEQDHTYSPRVATTALKTQIQPGYICQKELIAHVGPK